MTRRRLILEHSFALGDTILLTALVRDIQTVFPDQFEIRVKTHYREVFDNNPHCKLLLKNDTTKLPVTKLKISYGEGIKSSQRGQKIHMLSAYHKNFAVHTGMDLMPLLPKGDLHLTPAELEPIVKGRYWVVMAGGKQDITTKWWRPGRWQEVVDKLAGHGIRCVQAGAAFNGHKHPTLNNCLSLLGQTQSARQFMNLIHHADGVICAITGAMHIAACFNKPAVVIAGGREAPWWEAYTNQYKAFGPRCDPVAVEHRFLHTIGLLDCCKGKGCWKHRTVPLKNNDRFDKQLCKLPVIMDGSAAPKCLDLITVDQVLEAVMSYGSGTSEAVPELVPQKTVVVLPAVEAEPEVSKTLLSPPAVMSQRPARPAMIDHPLIGGQLTVFVLCYGDHFALARTVTTAIFDTIPADCLDLRVGMNAVCDATRTYVNGLCPKQVTKAYDWPGNIKKYPAQRLLFRDPAHPITTPYLVWVDDDVRVQPAAWSHLCSQIVANHPNGYRMYGNVFVHDLKPYFKNGHDPRKWFQSAAWYRGRQFRVRGTLTEGSNGSSCLFVAGWFWALCVETMILADVPDARILNNGDICAGEQVHQLGFKIKDINNRDKRFAWCPSKETGGRRSAPDPFPWTLPAAR